ncbi:MAG: C39 family peptidase [Prochloraceae cyanobacterium]|nr:C39 family peptidase [Prochloraceae cyanobacterium]
MSSTVIKATATTYLKSEPKDSSQLAENQKMIIPKDTVLELTNITGLDRKHYGINLKEPIEDFNVGFVFAPHWGIVSSDDPDLVKESAPKHKNPAVQRQIERLSKYLPADMKLDLGVKTKYFSQRDNYTMSHRTCCSSSNAMYLDWLLRVSGKPGLDNDDSYLKKVLANGDTIYHHIQSETIAEYGFKTKWMTDADLDFVEDLVDTGFPVVVNILHRGSMSEPRGGHIIMLIGRKKGYWIAHDPYGTLQSNYSVTDGQYSRISEREFSARWQGGYRILK